MSLRGAEFCVSGEGLPPVVTRLDEVARGVVVAGEAVMGAGLLVLVVDLIGQAERRGLLDLGVAGSPGGEVDFSQAVECLGLTGPVAGFAAYRHCLLEVFAGLLVVSQPRIDDAEVAQGVCLTVPVTSLDACGQRLTELLTCFLEVSQSQADDAEVAQGVGLVGPVAGLAGNGHGLIEVFAGLPVVAEPQFYEAEVVVLAGLPGSVAGLTVRRQGLL